MVNSADHSQILYQAYEQFLLPVFNKKVPMPYRINIPPDEHPAKQGKRTPEVILKQLQEDARNQNFDLQKASMEETREFMRKNQLGIDCSGFAYRILDFLVQKIKGKSLEDFGFPHVGITNVNILTSDEFSVPIDNFTNAQPGDLIRLDSKAVDGIPHCLVILDSIITYAHSSRQTNPDGVHTAQIKDEKFPDDLKMFRFKKEEGDGIRRLKILQ